MPEIVRIGVGFPGRPGPLGKSAYQVWLDEGNTGTEADFLASLKGPEGDKGDPGPGTSFVTFTDSTAYTAYGPGPTELAVLISATGETIAFKSVGFHWGTVPDPDPDPEPPTPIDPAETQMYFDNTDAPLGPVTSLTARGTWGATFTTAGTGNDAVMQSDGLHITGGKYLRWITGVPATAFRSATVVLDMTIAGTAVGTPQIARLDTTPADSFADVRIITSDATGHLPGMFGPNNTQIRTEIYKPSGHRFTASYGWDFRTGEIVMIDEDGYPATKTAPAPLADMVMSDVRFGQNCNIILHRVAVYGTPA